MGLSALLKGPESHLVPPPCEVIAKGQGCGMEAASRQTPDSDPDFQL